MRSILLAGTAICVLAAPASLPAQASSVHVTLVPRVGVLTQAAPFKMRPDFGPSGPDLVYSYRFEPDRVLGLAAEVTSDAWPVGLRVEVGRASSLRLERVEDSHGPPLWEEGSGSMSTATAAVLLQPARACIRRVVCPRLLLGGGVKRYRFDADLLSDDVIYPFAEDQSHFTLQVGAGVAARLSRVSLVAEVNDYSNDFRSFTHEADRTGRVHDVVATLGLAVHLN